MFSEYLTIRALMLPPLSVCDIHKYSSDVMAIIRYSECDIASIVIKQFWVQCNKADQLSKLFSDLFIKKLLLPWILKKEAQIFFCTNIFFNTIWKSVVTIIIWHCVA